MHKETILGMVNVLLSGFFLYILSTSSYAPLGHASAYEFIQVYSPYLIIGLSFLINAVLAYQLLYRRKTYPLSLTLALTGITLFWFVLFFVGYFFASAPLFLPIALLLAICIFWTTKRFSRKISVLLSAGTLVVAMMVLISSFEEDYCWKQGSAADASGAKMITATKEDAAKLKNFDVKEGTQIGVAFKAHMLCHQTFTFSQALKTSYSL